MAVNNFGEHFELSDPLTTPTGQSVLNRMKPMAFVFQTLAQLGTLNISINGINWVKSDGVTIEAASFGPALVPASSTTFYWIDINGVLQSGASFPDPNTAEFYAVARIVSDGLTVTELHQFGNPRSSPTAAVGISGQLVGVELTGVSLIPLPQPPITTTAIDFIVVVQGARLNSSHYTYEVGPQRININNFPVIAGDKINVNYQKA